MFRWQGSFPLHFLFSAVAGSQISSIACPFYSCPTALPCPPFSWPVRGIVIRIPYAPRVFHASGESTACHLLVACTFPN